MDVVTLALAKSYTDSQRLASIESHKVVCDFKSESEITVPFLTYNYRWFSEKMPTPGELKAASVNMKFGNSTAPADLPYSLYTVLPSSTGICSTLWTYEHSEFVLGILAAYEAGQHTFTYEGQEFTVEAPRKGLYVMVPDEVLEDELVQKSEFFHVDIAWESVKTIDQKLLPGVCLPVVELSSLIYIDSERELTEEESAQLQAAYDTGLPAIIKFRVCNGGTGDNPDYNWVSMMFYHNMQMVNDYSCMFYTLFYSFAPGNDGSKWMYLIQDLSGGN